MDTPNIKLVASSTEGETLSQFLTRVRAMSSGAYKPGDGGPLSSTWRFREHAGFADRTKQEGRAFRGRADRRRYTDKRGA